MLNLVTSDSLLPINGNNDHLLIKSSQNSTVEPQIIDEELLQNAVISPIRPDGRLTEPYDFPYVTELHLSYKNINKINNLETFYALEVLKLDNNIIHSIENLSHLRNLKSLNLSFNNITEIRGLENLSQLQDLLLYGNKISKVQNLEHLEFLQILSIGQNNIANIDDIFYLRKIKNLRCLCIKDNPICQIERFQETLTALLPNLDYIDYVMQLRKKNDNSNTNSEIVHNDIIVKALEKEKMLQQNESNQKAKQKILEYSQELFFDSIETIHEDFFNPNVISIPGLMELRDYQDLSNDFINKIVEKKQKWKESISTIGISRIAKWMNVEACIKSEIHKNNEETKNLVKQFQRSIKQAREEITNNRNYIFLSPNLSQTQLSSHLNSHTQLPSSNSISPQHLSFNNSISTHGGPQTVSNENLESAFNTFVNETVETLVNALNKLKHDTITKEIVLHQMIEECVNNQKQLSEEDVNLFKEKIMELLKELEISSKEFIQLLYDAANDANSGATTNVGGNSNLQDHSSINGGASHGNSDNKNALSEQNASDDMTNYNLDGSDGANGGNNDSLFSAITQLSEHMSSLLVTTDSKIIRTTNNWATQIYSTFMDYVNESHQKKILEINFIHQDFYNTIMSLKQQFNTSH